MDRSGREMCLANGTGNFIFIKLKLPGCFPDAKWVMELPAQIQLAGAVKGRTIDRPECPAVSFETQFFKRDGMDYCRHIGEAGLDGSLIAGLLPDGMKEGKARLYFYFQAGEKRLNERMVEARIFPEVSGKKTPMDFKLWLWRGAPLSCTMGHPGLFDAMLGAYADLGMSAFAGDGNREFISRLHGRGMKYFHLHHCNSPYNVFENELALPDEYWAVDHLGNRLNEATHCYFTGKRIRTLCPARFNRESDKLLGVLLKDDMEALDFGADGALFDLEIEMPPLSVCHCGECLRSFAENAGLDPEGMTSSVVLERHKTAWIKFRAGQIRETMRLIGERLRSRKKNVLYYIVDHSLDCEPGDAGREARWLERTGGSDIRLLDSVADVHGPMWYTDSKRIYSLFELNRPSLKKPLIPMLDIGQYEGARSKPPAFFRMDLLSAASSGAAGAMVYHCTALDGEYAYFIGRARVEIGLLKRYFYEGKRCDDFIRVMGVGNFAGWEDAGYIQFKVHELRGQWLVSLFNFSGTLDAGVRLHFSSLSQGEYILKDPVDPALIQGKGGCWDHESLKKGLDLKIPPMDVRFLLLEPQRQGDAKK